LDVPAVWPFTLNVFEPFGDQLIELQIADKDAGGKPRSNHVLEVITAARPRSGA